jgi:hypothetical protein
MGGFDTRISLLTSEGNSLFVMLLTARDRLATPERLVRALATLLINTPVHLAPSFFLRQALQALPRLLFPRQHLFTSLFIKHPFNTC